MRIAFDYQIFWAQRYGGISRYFAKLLGELDELGETAVAFAPVHNNGYLSELPERCVRGWQTDRRPRGSRRMGPVVNRIVCGKQIASWKPDVVHETYFSERGSARAGVPVVLTVYDMIHELFAEDFGKNNPDSDRKRKAVERADHIICISEHTRQDLIRLLDVPPAKTTTIHLAIDAVWGAPECVGRPDQSGRPFLLYVGARGIRYKNFGGLLRAMGASARLCDEFDLVAFGGGPLRVEELEEARQNGLRPGQVRQVGGDDSVLRRLYAEAAAFVYPSLYEGFGLPPLEAMACGCPVVSSNTSCMPEIIGDAGELVDPESADLMAAGLERVLFDSEYRADLIVRGHRRLGEFSWRRCAKETMAVYRGVIGKTGGSATE
jgi:glycosyltransferase involved in cell wall biosynthesis